MTLTACGLIGGLLIQSASIVWWGARIDQRMTTVEQKVSAYASTDALLARMDERTASLTTTVNRIDARINAQDDAALSARSR